MKRNWVALLRCALRAANPSAQFTGPGVAAPVSTVGQLNAARQGCHVSLSGNIVAHQREIDFTFRDSSGEIRVEIVPALRQGRPVGPQTKLRGVGEVDQGTAGRYVWVKSLDNLP